MNNQEMDIKLPTIEGIRLLLRPIVERLENIESKLDTQNFKQQKPKYYRNNDIKEIFNLSSNTIVKYRETGVIPYTKLGDIYLYEVKSIEAILEQNSIKLT
ncbi:MAG: hypothetical protein Tsb0033_22530 [Winogradskyella sp.]